MRTKKEGVVLVTFLTALSLSTMVWAVDCPLPDTGQTKCYDDSVEITCPSSGRPFYGQDAQFPCNPQSYTKLDANGNDLPDTASSWVMVRDNVTGLIWEVKTDDGSIHDKDTIYNWQDAQDEFIAALNNGNFGGNSDWRMPTVKELSTLVDSSKPAGPSINTEYSPNTVSNYYWSSTTYAGDTGYAWSVSFNLGHVNRYSKSYNSYVRAVRGEPCGPFSNYVSNGDGTVTDTGTGLMWQQDAAPGTYNWEDSLSYCGNLQLADYSDWRLPNTNELQSLVDYTRKFPSINTDYFPDTVLNNYWSSTTSAYYTSNVWVVGFDEGNMESFSKLGNFYVRAVRGGPCGSSDSTTTTTTESSTTTTTIASTDIITLTSGTLNGQSIDPGDSQVTVVAGASIVGTVNITVSNSHDARAAVPVCWTPNWEDQGGRETIYERIDTWAPVGDIPYPVYVELTAPSTEGTYHILFGSSAEIDCGDVMSNTNWAYGDPVWNDNNDFIDFDVATIQDAIENGWVEVNKLTSDGNLSGEVGANAVQITVVSEVSTTTTTTPDLTSITGTVTEFVVSGTGGPIAGALVTCGESSDTTDVDGKYDLNQTPGKWTIKVEAEDYLRATKEITIDPTDTALVENFFLVPLVNLTGNVSDMFSNDDVGEVTINVSGVEVISDTNGNYELQQMPGKWFIEVTAKTYAPVVVTDEAEEGDTILEKNFSIAKSGLLGLITGTVKDQVSWGPIEWVEISTDGGGYTFSSLSGYYNLYQKPGSWTMEADCDGYISHSESVTVDQGGQNKIIDIEMSPIATSTTTTTGATGTTTTVPGLCSSEKIYGEHSQETEHLRYFRDNVLTQSPEGQEIIRLYYEWSPVIVKAMEDDEEFKEEVKEMIDGVLELIGE